MKNRFSALDVAAVVRDLQWIVNMRLQNIYDVNSKTFSLKFSRTEEKALVLIESGIRFHSTEYEREKPIQPSSFATKLRKHLRQKRLTAIRQTSIMDRVAIFEFGGHPLPTQDYYLICEFYDSGNLILTNGEYTILSVLRVTQVQDANYKVGSTLQLRTASLPPAPQPEDALRILEAQPNLAPKKLLAAGTAYPGFLVAHVVQDMALPTPYTPEHAPRLLEALQALHTLATAPPLHDATGYIYSDAAHPDLYVDVQPVALAQYADAPCRTFPTFDRAADTYFSALETQRVAQRETQHAAAAARKLEAIAHAQQTRVAALLDDQAASVRHAQLVETHAARVDATRMIVNQAVATGMDWRELERMVADERARGHPIAMGIHHLELKANTVYLLLEDAVVPVQLGMSALANARALYTQKKRAVVKQQKTEAVHSKALKSAQTKIEQEKRQKQRPLAVGGWFKVRKPFWFEKFHWCFSSETYLMLAGRDMHQNEWLVKKYLKQGDVYVHADLHGAPSVVVKNREATTPIPPSTLAQAGCMALCMSKAWENKMVTSAWWVSADQVSKSAPSGEYLTTGSFMIRGRKNFLPPAQLVYGLGVLFKLDEESTLRRKAEREEDRPENRGVDGKAPSAVALENGEKEQEWDDSEEEKGMHTGEEDLEGFNEMATGSDHENNEEEGARDHCELESFLSAPTLADTTLFGASQKKAVDVSDDDAFVYELEEMLQLEEDRIPEGAIPGQPNFPESSSINYTDDVLLGTEGSGLAEPLVGKRGAKEGRRFLSVAERRRLKKTGTLEPQTPQSEDSERSRRSSKGNAPVDPAPKPAASVRGKHGKMKKIKQKYADQDDEDRALAMALLKSDQGPQPKGKKQKQKLAKQLEMERAQQVWLERQKEKQAQSHTKDTPFHDAQEAGSSESMSQPAEVSSMEPAPFETPSVADEEIPIDVAEDEAENLDEEDEKEALTTFPWSELDSLTHSPTANDQLLYAIPVCAPYQSLQAYKLKVKLQPGSLKKGKAYKTCLNIFMNQTHDPREQLLMKEVREPEWINAIRGGVKILAPQLMQLKQQQKQKQKSKAKAKSNDIVE